MELTEFTFKLIILCIPGITCYILLSRLIGKFNKDILEKILIIFLYAGLIYVIYGSFCYIRNAIFYQGYKCSLINNFFKNNINIDLWDIFGLEVTSILLAIFSSYAFSWNWLNRIGIKFGATNRYGDEDIWEHFNNNIANEKWVFVRDHKYKLIYFGFLDLWSDSEKKREIVLSTVDVFHADNPDTKLYDSDKIYLSRNHDDLTIEIPVQ